MKVVVNNEERDVPFFLADFTLGQYIEYHKRYGSALAREYDELISNDVIDSSKEVDISDHLEKEALSWFTFWTSFDFINAKNVPGIQDAIQTYHLLKEGLLQCHPIRQNRSADVFFNNETWYFQLFGSQTPTLEDTMNLKAANHYLQLLLLGCWEVLPILCAIYLRKKDEPLTEDLIEEGSERIALMNQLPMDVAMALALILKEGVYNENLIQN